MKYTLTIQYPGSDGHIEGLELGSKEIDDLHRAVGSAETYKFTTPDGKVCLYNLRLAHWIELVPEKEQS